MKQNLKYNAGPIIQQSLGLTIGDFMIPKTETRSLMMKKIIPREKPNETRIIKSNVAKKKTLVDK